MCICDDLMTVTHNHSVHPYLFDNRNWILVATLELQEFLKSVHLGDLFFNFFQALFKHDMCICDDLMTVSCNHSAHTYLFNNRNWILVATHELQECLKIAHLGDLFLIIFQALFKHDMCISDDLMTVTYNHIANTYLLHPRNFILVATRELQECLKSVHLGDLFFIFLQAIFKHDMCIFDDLMTVSRNHIADT